MNEENEIASWCARDDEERLEELVSRRRVAGDVVTALEAFIKHQGASERLALVLQLENILNGHR
jgi:hypothetical protein